MSADTPTTPAAPATPKPAKKSVATKKPAKVSKKPAAVDISKSDEVRKLAAATKAKGEKPRPSLIVASLAKQGIHVAAAQVSIVLKKMGFRPLSKRRKKGAAAGGPKAGTQKASQGAAAAVSVDDLLTAKKAVASLGGSERALEAIQALRRLEG
jgi:hypothetical protein